jgi:hypothetical protein
LIQVPSSRAAAQPAHGGLEVVVEPDVEPLLLHDLPERPGDVERLRRVERDHAPRVGRVEPDRPVAVGHREDALREGVQQRVRVEADVAAHDHDVHRTPDVRTLLRAVRRGTKTREPEAVLG